MKAMIMAAGRGTRMGKITETLPKVLVDINGKSLLQIAVETCTSHGFGDIIVNVHYMADLVEKEVRRLNRSGFRISVSDERDMLLENGGGLYKARDFFNTDPFLVYNADIVTDLDLTELYRQHIANNSLATLAVRKREGNRFLLVDKEGILRGWCNRATGEEIIAVDIDQKLEEVGFSSVQVIDPEIFRYMKEGIYTVVILYLQLASFRKIATCRFDDGYWFNVGTPENLVSVRNFLKIK